MTEDREAEVCRRLVQRAIERAVANLGAEPLPGPVLTVHTNECVTAALALAAVAGEFDASDRSAERICEAASVYRTALREAVASAVFAEPRAA